MGRKVLAYELSIPPAVLAVLSITWPSCYFAKHDAPAFSAQIDTIYINIVSVDERRRTELTAHRAEWSISRTYIETIDTNHIRIILVDERMNDDLA
jgi:hypothetical protein